MCGSKVALARQELEDAQKTIQILELQLEETLKSEGKGSKASRFMTQMVGDGTKSLTRPGKIERFERSEVYQPTQVIQRCGRRTSEIIVDEFETVL